MRDNLTVQIDARKRSEVAEKMHRSQIEQLGKISGYSALDAKKELVESLKSDAQISSHVLYQRLN